MSFRSSSFSEFGEVSAVVLVRILIRLTFLPRQLLGLFRQHLVDKQFGVVEVARALQDTDAANFITGAFARRDQLQRRALFFFQRIVVQEADADMARFTAGGVARRGDTGFRVLGDVSVELFKIIESLIVPPQLGEGRRAV